VILLLLGLLPLAGCRFTIDYRLYAVVYGVADYSSLPPSPNGDLSYTDDDALDMAALLENQGFAVQLRLNGEANRPNLLADFAHAASLAGPEDLFLFYFSGHGGPSTVRATPEPPGADRATEGIILDDPGPPAGVDLLSDDELAALLASIPARKRVVIIDSCNSGGFIGNGLETDRMAPDYGGTRDGLIGVLSRGISLYANFSGSQPDIPPSLALVMAAAGEREFSYEDSGYDHGVFTYHLLQAPLRADRNRDGFVTVSEAYGYVLDVIEREWNRRYAPYPEAIFAPRISGGPVDYVLFQAR
jgi:uncharacterized caspase-like protein